MSIKVCCDFCDKPLPEDAENPDFSSYHVYKFGRVREVNVRLAFPHLCESCAEKIDHVVTLAKDEWLKQIDILDRNSKINEARKGLLGTKG